MAPVKAKKAMDPLKEEIILQLLWESSDSNEELQKTLYMRHMLAKHPSVLKLVSQYKPDLLRITVNQRKLYSVVQAALREKCRRIAEFMKLPEGDDHRRKDQSGTGTLVSSLSTEITKFKEECAKITILEQQLQKENDNFTKTFAEYHQLLVRYYEEYGIEYMNSTDKANVNFLCSKVQTLTWKKRLQNTRKEYSKYGTQDVIKKAKKERSRYERENHELQLELKDKKDRLQLYQDLNPDLLKQFFQLKEELNCRKWALSELNLSNVSDDVGAESPDYM